MSTLSAYANDDVEYLYTERAPFVSCQLCNRSLDHLTLEEREDHYAVHFAQEEEKATGSITGLDRPNNTMNLTGGGGETHQPRRDARGRH